MRKSIAFLAITVTQLMILATLLGGGRLVTGSYYGDHADQLRARSKLVRLLELTDLSVWTEARYTRHPSQADFFAPFQDFPSSPEHFPSGSIITPSGISPAAAAGQR